MRPVILLGGIHDGLELELKPERTVVQFPVLSFNPRDLFPTEMEYPVVEDSTVTYKYTSEKNKEGRWIFQII